jgi:gluconolactonase
MSGEIVSHDNRFAYLSLPTGNLVQLCSGMLWTEGPVYFPLGDYLLWSDIPNNRMWQWIDGVGARVFRQGSNNSNGNFRDLQGRLVTCEHLTRRVTRTEHDGSITIIVESYGGKRLNSPNDVVVKSDGTIWFTDPPYGILSDYEGRKSEQEQDGCHVYRFDPSTGGLDIVADDFDKPNGLAFSIDESILYVSDTGASHSENGPHHIRCFDVIDNKALKNSRVFKEIDHGVPDGFRLDINGNIWTSTGVGVKCYSPQAQLLGEILIDEEVSNLTFGGPKKNRLYITATTSLYAIYLGITGVI